MTAEIFSGMADVILGVFGSETAILQRAGAQAVVVDIVFDKSYRAVQEGSDGVPVEILAKAATLSENAAAGVKHGDTLLIGSSPYTVRGIVPAGGLVTLVLSG